MRPESHDTILEATALTVTVEVTGFLGGGSLRPDCEPISIPRWGLKRAASAPYCSARSSYFTSRTVLLPSYLVSKSLSYKAFQGAHPCFGLLPIISVPTAFVIPRSGILLCPQT